MPRREKRKRDYIPKDEIIASLVGDHLLTREHRDRLRAARVPAQDVKRLTTPDHNIRHAQGGSDAWWNLTIRLRGPELKAKDNRDTSEIAKSDRISAAYREHLAAMARKLAGPSPFEDMTKRPRSRWPQSRKIRDRGSFQRRP